jgi:archaellum component FlaC
MTIEETLKDVELDTLSAWERLSMAWNSLNENQEHHARVVQLLMEKIEKAMNCLEAVQDEIQRAAEKLE